MNRHIVNYAAVACATVLAVFGGLRVVQGQAPAQVPDAAGIIPSLTEPGERLDVRTVAPASGLVTFATAAGQGMLVPLGPAAPAEARALSFVDTYGESFGLADSSQVRVLKAASVDGLGVEHVRLQQVHQGVPVRAGEFLVHLRGARAVAANGHLTNRLPDDVTPDITAQAAQANARGLIEKHLRALANGAVYSVPRLEILDRQLFADAMDSGSRLAWFVQATAPALNEYIWVDAKSGIILLNFSQLTYAKTRRVYTASHTNTLPGTLLRSEGGPPTGDADSDNAYDYAGLTYDYFLNSHGRDSYDNLGSPLLSTTHYCPPDDCPSYANAFWNGTQMVYGDTYASADDVVGHELTHAVTEFSAGLLYYQQSGALNESFSDIFGETIDLLDGVGNDAAGVRWQMGEDLPIGSIRNMMTPTASGDPGKMSDPQLVCATEAWTDPFEDRGGVHSNSGIPNHAYALMVDGGSYNGRTITGIGLDKAARVQYRALTVYLTSGSGFLDNFNALNQSCTDLTGTGGITASDCTQVQSALLAVEMSSQWACAGGSQAPPLCTTGTPSPIALDTFEAGIGNWTAANNSQGTWARDYGFAKGGTFMLYGTDPPEPTSHSIGMTNAVAIPAGARLYFDHAFEFENGFSARYDGGVVEYSTNNGATWTDAGSLIDGGRTYNGTIASGGGNVLQGRSAFTAASYGYTGTRLNLAPLAGQNVKFRFRIGTDALEGSLGWMVDNVTVYTCALNTPPSISAHPQSTSVGFGLTTLLTVTATGPSLSYQWYSGTTGATASPIGGATSNMFSTPGLMSTRRYWVRVSNSAGNADSSTATVTVTFTDTPLVSGVTPMRVAHIAELRTRIDLARVARGLAAYSWTDPAIVPQVTTIQAAHITDMRTAVSQAYAAAGLPAPLFTDPALPASAVPIKLLHINELRAAVMGLE
jgi:Zn-dependent metalloprotease